MALGIRDVMFLVNSQRITIPINDSQCLYDISHEFQAKTGLIVRNCCFYNSSRVFQRRVKLIAQLGNDNYVVVGKQLDIVINFENKNRKVIYVTTFSINGFLRNTLSYFGINSSFEDYYIHNGDFIPFSNGDTIPFNGFTERILYIAKKKSCSLSPRENDEDYNIQISGDDHKSTHFHCSPTITIKRIVVTYCSSILHDSNFQNYSFIINNQEIPFEMTVSQLHLPSTFHASIVNVEKMRKPQTIEVDITFENRNDRRMKINGTPNTTVSELLSIYLENCNFPNDSSSYYLTMQTTILSESSRLEDISQSSTVSFICYHKPISKLISQNTPATSNGLVLGTVH